MEWSLYLLGLFIYFLSLVPDLQTQRCPFSPLLFLSRVASQPMLVKPSKMEKHRIRDYISGGRTIKYVCILRASPGSPLMSNVIIASYISHSRGAFHPTIQGQPTGLKSSLFTASYYTSLRRYVNNNICGKTICVFLVRSVHPSILCVLWDSIQTSSLMYSHSIPFQVLIP